MGLLRAVFLKPHRLDLFSQPALGLGTGPSGWLAARGRGSDWKGDFELNSRVEAMAGCPCAGLPAGRRGVIRAGAAEDARPTDALKSQALQRKGRDGLEFPSPPERRRCCPPASPIAGTVVRRRHAPAGAWTARSVASSRHGGTHGSDEARSRRSPGAGCRLRWAGPPAPAQDATEGARPGSSSARKFRPAIPRSGCSSAEPVSASPGTRAEHSLRTLGGEWGRLYFASQGTVLLCVDRPEWNS